MTWRTARAQLETMIEGIPESSIYATGDFGRRFTHEPRMFDTSFSGNSRRFGLRGASTVTRNAATGTSSRRWQTLCELLIDYAVRGEGDRLDDALWTDYETIVERLLATTTWGRPTSTIEALTVEAFDIEASTEDIDDENGVRVGRRLTILFLVLHTAQTS